MVNVDGKIKVLKKQRRSKVEVDADNLILVVVTEFESNRAPNHQCP
jgi:hypothetical protein